MTVYRNPKSCINLRLIVVSYDRLFNLINKSTLYIRCCHVSITDMWYFLKFSMDMLYLFVFIRYLYNVQVISCILTDWLTWVSWRRIHSNTIPLLHLIAFWYYARLIFIHKSTTRTNGRNLKLNFCFEETVEILGQMI